MVRAPPSSRLWLRRWGDSVAPAVLPRCSRRVRVLAAPLEPVREQYRWWNRDPAKVAHRVSNSFAPTKGGAFPPNRAT
jgi:hypothetical protein